MATRLCVDLIFSLLFRFTLMLCSRFGLPLYFTRLSATFGIDLENVFDSSIDTARRLPDVILRLDRVDIDGTFGLNEWSADLTIRDEITFGISEAKALIDIGAAISGGDAIVLASASDFTNLFNSSSSTHINLTAGVDVDFPLFVIIDAVGFTARVGYVDENILDSVTSNITFGTDVLFATDAIQKAAEELKDIAKTLEVEALSNPLPLADKSLDELIAGDGRKISGIFDLTAWANGLSGTALNDTASPSGPDEGYKQGYITKTELLKEIRKGIQGALDGVDPASVDLKEIPKLPAVSSFQPEESIIFSTGIGHSGFCSGIDKAISVSIDGDENDFNITICSLLGFDEEIDLDPSGLLDLNDFPVELDFDDPSAFIDCSLTLGAQIHVVKDTGGLSASVSFEPINLRVAVGGNPTVTLGLGVVDLESEVNALLEGDFGLTYCSVNPDVNCVGDDSYERLSNSSSFYLKRDVGYDLSGSVTLKTDLDGLNFGDGLMLGIRDVDVFDDIAPEVEIPDFDDFNDIIKFSPANAISLLRLIDSALAEAAQNDAFQTQVPLMDKATFSDILSVGKSFTASLYEFFVQAEPFDERGVKSLTLRTEKNFSTYTSGEGLMNCGEYGNEICPFELYLVKGELTVNPDATEANINNLREISTRCKFDLVNITNTPLVSYVENLRAEVNNSCSITACSKTECGGSYEEDGGSNFYCANNCDIIIDLDPDPEDDQDGEVLFLTTVPYRNSNKTVINDIQLMGIYHENLTDVKGKTTILGLPINSPVLPAIVPRFRTLPDLAEKMSQVLSDVTNLDVEITASYESASESDSGVGSFLIGVKFGKAIGLELGQGTLEQNLALGDLASIGVSDSQLTIGGEASFYTEFGVILEAPSEKGLIMIGNACNGTGFNCTFEDPFHFILEWTEDGTNKVRNLVARILSFISLCSLLKIPHNNFPLDFCHHSIIHSSIVIRLKLLPRPAATMPQHASKMRLGREIFNSAS